MTAGTITCPFCGLCCDDLVAAGGRVETHGCPKAAAGFARAASAPRPHAVGGRPVELAEAAAAAAAILGGAAAPLVHGLAADLHGLRALLALADRIGAAVDHMNSSALLANAAVARASGWVAATFGEVANRADAIVVIGADPQRGFPRFHERLIANPAPLYRTGPPRLAYLGPDASALAMRGVAIAASVEEGRLLDALGVLALRLRGGEPRDTSTLPLAELMQIADALLGARYGAIVWDVSGFPAEEAEAAVELIAAMLRQLNANTRCVGLPLGGSENGSGALQAALWQTGWPLRIAFGAQGPLHDPWEFDGPRLLAAGEADALLWVAALAQSAPPPSGVPTVALVGADVELTPHPSVEIRVGIPAVDHGGEIVRGDGLVALPLHPAFASVRPSVAEAAAAILGALGPAA